MRKINFLVGFRGRLFAFIMLIIMTGCSGGNDNGDNGDSGVLTSDFTPCWGVQQGPSIRPAQCRVLIATSANGIDFQRLADPKQALVIDRVGVPDAVVLASGRILLYFVAGCKYYEGAEHNVDEIAVAVSDDNASSWVFKNVNFSGIPGNLSRAVDPNVVLMPSGELSLFGTMWLDNDPKPRIYSFLSKDGGFTYAFQGLRYDPDACPVDGVLDPENYRFSDANWQIFTGGPCGHALSTDGGNTFTNLGSFSNMFVTHEVAVTDTPGAYRAYVLGSGGLAIRSLRSDAAPWSAWTPEDGERLTLSTASAMESCELGFPTVIKTPSHGYFMFYQTTIPGYACGGGSKR
jgi:hypothetical protein